VLAGCLAAVVLALAGLAACTRDRSGTGPVPDPPADPGVLVLQLRETPGMPGPTEVGALPEFSLYGGGRVLVPGDRAGALQTARSYQLTASAYHDIYRRAFAAGLNVSRRIDQPPAPDAPTLTVSLLIPDGTRVTTVTTPAQHDRQRDPIAALRGSLHPDSWPGGDLVAGPSAYQPTQIAVIATWSAPASAGPAPDWPLDPLGTGERVDSGQCRIYPSDRIGQLAGAATPNTRWRSDDALFYTVFRPLLPGETGCASLTGK
jgi:hypothetical protein